MANDTDFNIVIGAEADENSAKKAVKDITKAVDNSVKGGRIEIPIDITVPIDKTNAKLTKAQNAIVKEISRMTSEGFSASGEDIVKLNKKFNKFKSEFKDAGGVQKYSDAFKQIKKDVDLIEKRFKSLNGFSQKDIKAAQNAWTKEIKSRESKKARYDGLRSTGPKGYKKGSIDPGRTNEHEARMSELSSYPSGMNRQMIQSERDFYKNNEAARVKARINKEEAEARATKLIEQKNRKRKPTATEEAKELSDVIRKNMLPNLLDQIRQADTDDIADSLISDLTTTMKIVSNLSQEAGQLIFSDVKKTVGTAMGKAGYTTFGNIGGTNGDNKTEKSYDPKMERALQTILDEVAKKEEEIIKEQIKLEQLTEKSVNKSTKEVNSYMNRLITENRNNNLTQTQNSKKVSDAVNKVQSATQKQTQLDTIEHDAERVADERLHDIEKTDAEDGFNSESNANELIDEVRAIKNDVENGIPSKEGETKEENLLPDLYRYMENGEWKIAQAQEIASSVDYLKKTGYEGRSFIDKTDYKQLQHKMAVAAIEHERAQLERGEHPSQQRSHMLQQSLSSVATALGSSKILNTIRRALGITGRSASANEILKMNRDQQANLQAERRTIWGLPRSNDAGATGGKALAQYMKNLYNRKTGPDPFKDLTLSEGVNFDLDKITEAMRTTIDKNMFSAQTGGFFKNVIGPATLYLGQPSLEKSRAQIDGLNTVMAMLRQVMNDLIQSIQENENELRGMEGRGFAKFDASGKLISGTPEAHKVFADLEEQKMTLNGIVAEVRNVDQIVSHTGGNVTKTLRQLGFAAPELMKCNTIVRNLNAGLDKNGKALKFQSRTAEILNYTFQLMGRHIGQMLKSWLLMLNPLNWIKKAFNDFMSYDIKWQRTMNVIKYNLRAIIKPFMQWIAQSLVNVIGFLDIISMRIQQAFGKIPVSLFDQVAADAEKTAEEVNNVSAGFDELHDIGSDSNGANDLFGDIYKPQLSKEWEELAERIGDLFGKLFTGKTTLKEFLKEAGSILWDFFKQLCTDIGKWIDSTLGPKIKSEFLKLLDTLLKIFLGWQLLKIAGKLLWNAFFGSFSAGSGTSVLKSLFTDKNGVVGIGQNIGTLIAGGIITVISAMALKDAINSAWETGGKDAVTGKDLNLNDKQTNMDALKGALGGAGVVVGGGMIAAALGASVALGPLVAVAAGVAALAAVVVVAAEAWNYHAKQNKIANNEMLEAADYAAQAEDAQNRLNEVNEVADAALKTKNTNQEKLNQLQNEYGMSLGWVTEKVRRAGGDTSVLTESEKELYDQGTKTQKSIENYNRLLELQIKLTNEAMWKKEEEAIKLDMEAKNYEMAMLRIEQAELEGTITTEEATKKRIQLYKECGETERYELLQNLTPEQRTLMAQYTNATEEELGKLAKIWNTSSESTRNALLDGVGPDVQDEYRRRLNAIDEEVKKHQGFWQGVGDTIKEVLSFGQANTWTYNGETKYYEEGYGRNYKQQRRQELETEISQIERNPLMSEQEKKRQIQSIRNRIASLAVGTNYVPNDGLAYLHQGEAVIPKKYNQPYQQGMSNEERAYMQQLMTTMRSLDGTMKQGIAVNGQFTQRGSDLVAVVNRTNSQTGADLLSNVSYAR